METGHLCLSFFLGGKGEREITMGYDYGEREKCLDRRAVILQRKE